MRYTTSGSCSTHINIEIENDVITQCEFIRGCPGNTRGLAKMVIGCKAIEVMNALRGTPCIGSSSCPDQLSYAIEECINQGDHNKR